MGMEPPPPPPRQRGAATSQVFRAEISNAFIFGLALNLLTEVQALVAHESTDFMDKMSGEITEARYAISSLLSVPAGLFRMRAECGCAARTRRTAHRRA